MIPKLTQLPITRIYCSPFLRTLQTIKPYCGHTGMKVNIEWSLAESYPYDSSISNKFNDIINHDYVSYLPYHTPKTTDIMPS